MARGKYYITTPIYYPSDKLHIGHAYTTVAADAIARWHRLAGEDVWFLTGSDEHGQKIERAARSKGQEPREYVDEIVAGFKTLWARLDISYDGFVRTTERRHHEVVQRIFERIFEKGDIYKDEYEGQYCTPCETFWLESKLVDGKCPDCRRDVETVREESYFFRLSKYADRLLAHIEAHPRFIQPASRRNEMISFIKSGLEDLCISRTTFDWGIQVPRDPKHVIYVWFDALSNYLTGVGFLEEPAKFERFWPADLHLVGKEIVRFHTIIWPVILMAADLPIPEKVFGHGWLLFDQEKMSKSKGNVVDPHFLIDRFGVDPIRYFLLREISFGQDGNFSVRALIDRTNADLANDLGNLVYRALSMLDRYFGGAIPVPGAEEPSDRTVRELAVAVAGDIKKSVNGLELNLALAALWRLVGRLNKYIDEGEPWALFKKASERSPGRGSERAGARPAPVEPAAAKERLGTVMYTVAEGIRVVGLLVYPFLPRTGAAVWEQLGISEPITSAGWNDVAWGGLRPGTVVRRGQPLFPRIETEQSEVQTEQAEVRTQQAGVQTEQAESQKRTESASNEPEAGSPTGVPPGSGPMAAGGRAPVARRGEESATPPSTGGRAPAEGGASRPNAGSGGELTIDEFSKVELRVAKVKSAGRVEGSDRLIRMILELDESGGTERQVVAGIAKHYTPETLVGRRVVIVANLKPAEIRGCRSEGMVLAAVSDNGSCSLVTVDDGAAVGARVR